MKKFFAVVVISALLFMPGCTSQTGAGNETGNETAAADFPKSTITIIVPYSAGGGTDLMSRLFAPKLEEILGVSIVVENLPGGSGAIGMAELIRSKADGYTIGVTAAGPVVITPLTSDVGYSIDNFTAVCQITDNPNVFCVHKDSGITSFEDFLAKAKENPGKMTYGTCGAGLTQNIFFEGFMNANDMKGLLTHVPFDGGAASVTALLGKQVDSILNASPEVVSYIQSGEFIPLAQTTARRIDKLADVPTLNDLGYEEAGGVWYGYVAPAGTPEEVISILDDAFNEAMKDEKVLEGLQNLNNEIFYLDHKDFQQLLGKEFAAYSEIIKGM